MTRHPRAIGEFAEQRATPRRKRLVEHRDRRARPLRDERLAARRERLEALRVDVQPILDDDPVRVAVQDDHAPRRCRVAKSRARAAHGMLHAVATADAVLLAPERARERVGRHGHTGLEQQPAEQELRLLGEPDPVAARQTASGHTAEDRVRELGVVVGSGAGSNRGLVSKPQRAAVFTDRTLSCLVKPRGRRRRTDCVLGSARA